MRYFTSNLTESLNDIQLYTSSLNSFNQRCRIMTEPKSRWYSFLTDLRGIPRSVNEPNFYFSRHFLMSPPPVLNLRCLDYIAERRQIGRISSLRRPFTRECAFTRYRYEESVNACTTAGTGPHTRGPAFTPAGLRVLPCRTVIIIWTATSGRIWCSGVACWANRATMSSPPRDLQARKPVIDHYSRRLLKSGQVFVRIRA